MKFNRVYLESFGHFLPESFITSDELEEKLTPIYDRLKLPKGRLELQTGIKSRGLWPVGTRPSDLSYQAALDCLDRSSIKASDIDLIIHSSVCRDFLEPATASVIHDKLNLKSTCLYFDLSNACLGMLSAIQVAASMIESGVIKNALLVSGENGGPLIEETINFLNTNMDLTRKSVKNYIANLTIGSAATAILLTNQHSNRPKLLCCYSYADTSANKLCQGDGNTHGLMMQTDSEELLKAGVNLVKNSWSDFLKNQNWKNSDIDLLIGHQVGVAHRLAILNSIEFPLNKDFSTFETLGNTGSSAWPVTLIKAINADKLKSGDKLALLGIGSGLNTIMAGIEWN